MGTCKICGKNFGLMGGGSEPYTGHNLQVCNSCGEVLKKIDKVKNEDTQEVKDLFVSVMSMTDDADVKQILTDYSKEECYISYREYTEDIEPIYMDCKLDTKQEFIKFFNETFEKMVYPVVEKILDDLPLTDTWEYVYGNRSDIQEKLETADDKARHLAYQYMRLYLGI